MKGSKKVVEIFYDVASPYGFIGFEAITRMCGSGGIWQDHLDLKLRPMFLGGVMVATGNKPPAMVPAKGEYMRTDLQRCADYYSVPLRYPKDISRMFNTLKAQRVLTAVSKYQPSQLEKVSRELYRRLWLNDQDIVEDNSFIEACTQAGVGIEDARDLVSRSKEDDIKNELKRVTQDAVDRGCFGSPTFYVENKMFFGSDRFPIIAFTLGLPYYHKTTEETRPFHSKL